MCARKRPIPADVASMMDLQKQQLQRMTISTRQWDSGDTTRPAEKKDKAVTATVTPRVAEQSGSRKGKQQTENVTWAPSG